MNHLGLKCQRSRQHKWTLVIVGVNNRGIAHNIDKLVNNRNEILLGKEVASLFSLSWLRITPTLSATRFTVSSSLYDQQLMHGLFTVITTPGITANGHLLFTPQTLNQHL